MFGQTPQSLSTTALLVSHSLMFFGFGMTTLYLWAVGGWWPVMVAPLLFSLISLTVGLINKKP